MQIKSENLKPGEMDLIQWQFDLPMGSFRTALWKAIVAADNNNMNLLALGFPNQVQAYRGFTERPGYWADVLNRAGLLPKSANETADEKPSED